MTPTDPGADLEAFVEDWLAAYVSDDPTRAARFYRTPLLAVFPGRVRTLDSRADVERFLANAASELRQFDAFRPGDDVAGTTEALRTATLDDDLVVVAGRWERRAPDGTLLDRVAFADVLERTDDGWRIAVALARDPADAFLRTNDGLVALGERDDPVD
jgi:ketosteroid isomerase-like protein